MMPFRLRSNLFARGFRTRRVCRRRRVPEILFRATGFPRRKRMSRITWSRAHGAKMESMHQGDFHAIDGFICINCERAVMFVVTWIVGGGSF